MACTGNIRGRSLRCIWGRHCHWRSCWDSYRWRQVEVGSVPTQQRVYYYHHYLYFIREDQIKRSRGIVLPQCCLFSSALLWLIVERCLTDDCSGRWVHFWTSFQKLSASLLYLCSFSACFMFGGWYCLIEHLIRSQLFIRSLLASAFDYFMFLWFIALKVLFSIRLCLLSHSFL